MVRYTFPLSVTLALLLGGCGGGGGGDTTASTTTTTTYTGSFVDAPVDGLAYSGTLGSSGVTENGGKFNFKAGEVITFSLGKVVLGDAAPSPQNPIVTPVTLVAYTTHTEVTTDDPKVLTIVKLLLTADADNNASNGITIPEDLATKLDQPLDLATQEVNETLLSDLLDENITIDDNEAKEHLEESLAMVYEEVETPPATPTTLDGDYRLLAWNDLGMHCMDGKDYSVFSILPPYNTLNAQLLKKGDEPEHITQGVTLTYTSLPSLDGKLNTTSSDKTNFWDYVKALFGIDLAPDKGLKGAKTASLTPQPMHYDPNHKWWIAEGIPITPYNDDGTKNYYPLVKVTAKDGQGNTLAETTTVLPVSDEMDCRKCHGSTSGYEAAKPDAGWANLQDAEKDYKTNILRLHDQEHPTAVAEHIASLQAKGYDYNTSGLEATASSGTPILCAACHRSNALPDTGVDDIKPLTRALHGAHANAIDPSSGMKLDDALNRSACYSCHPGATTQCLRGAMGAAKDANGEAKMQCQSCHGTMSAVASSQREGWLDMPGCQHCHQDGKRYTEAVTDMRLGTLRDVIDTRFATKPDTPMPGISLYRYSAGHGGMQCSACHGSTHAIYTSAKTEDNLQSIQTQGHAGTIGECSACHNETPKTADEGPHGMHSVGQWWVEAHEDVAEDGGSESCKACHGADYRGSPLSKTMSARTFSTEWGTKTFAAGHQVSCYDCHNGPGGEDENEEYEKEEYEEDD